MVTFSHLDAGSPEASWERALSDHVPAVPRLDIDGLLSGGGRLVVVAAHPDDETLGAGGLIAHAARAGHDVTVVVATSGEASHPHSPTHTPAQLARLREIETVAALAELAPEASVEFCRVPDGRLKEPAQLAVLVDRIDARLASASAGDENAVIVSPWAGDGHPDHAAAAEAAARVATGRGVRHLAYPIWLWHWADPDDPRVPWEGMTSLVLDADTHEAKVKALRMHLSQIAPLSDAAGDEVLLNSEMLRHFERDHELFVDASALPPSRSRAQEAAERFDLVHTGDDPWGFETRWYEQRKRDILLASLPDRRFGRVLEVGCSTGVLSRALAERCDDFVGIDVSSLALERARDRLKDLSHATFDRLFVPEEWPEGAFDLIVVSEVGYYLDDHELERLADRVLESAPGSTVVCCHWRHPVDGRPFSGDHVHEAFRACPGLQTLVHHLEEDFVLEVFARTSPGCDGVHPAPVSIARREGIL
ncbi:PIG-L family deacetylase [Herbiconiux moechotypicola]|uniref:Methyltransferase domain-containing protein n=1 Tax=Herbiconiux moechotypicola TaxID=637393 RepID=A0ABN3DMR9_9MICO|nr:bifunctional PIG-L family deacetylase/class I SAM-dependent methyltransferase [Herbiconiux moechotypicola]MCS5730235.1 PIG-L family deacetylase [Herbiconiux moechotypicola]